MKKALIITTISGFLSKFEMNDVKILQEYGYDIHYASNFHNPTYSFDIGELKKQGIKLHHVDIEKSPLAAAKNIKALKQVKEIIDREKIFLVHCHNPIGAVVGRVASHFSKMKPYVIYTAHGFHFYKGAPLKNWILYYTAEKFLAHKTDLIITINQEDYNRAKKFRLKDNGRVEWIHGVGVDIERFQPRLEKRAVKRNELKIPKNVFHIVTVAELNKNKNQKVIIQAIAHLGKKDIYYSICGKGKNFKNLEKLIKKYHLEKQVHLLGYRKDIEEILQTADCFVFPSIREGLGIAAIEALAVGIPLIVADNRGTREYTKNNYNGIICNANNVKDFEKAIKRFYYDINYRKNLSSHCREIAQEYSIEAINKRMHQIYKMADQNVQKRIVKYGMILWQKEK